MLAVRRRPNFSAGPDLNDRCDETTFKLVVFLMNQRPSEYDMTNMGAEDLMVFRNFSRIERIFDRKC